MAVRTNYTQQAERIARTTAQRIKHAQRFVVRPARSAPRLPVRRCIFLVVRGQRQNVLALKHIANTQRRNQCHRVW